MYPGLASRADPPSPHTHSTTLGLWAPLFGQVLGEHCCRCCFPSIRFTCRLFVFLLECDRHRSYSAGGGWPQGLYVNGCSLAACAVGSVPPGRDPYCGSLLPAALAGTPAETLRAASNRGGVGPTKPVRARHTKCSPKPTAGVASRFPLRRHWSVRQCPPGRVSPFVPLPLRQTPACHRWSFVLVPHS